MRSVALRATSPFLPAPSRRYLLTRYTDFSLSTVLTSSPSLLTTYQQDGRPQNSREPAPLPATLIWRSARYASVPGNPCPSSTPPIQEITLRQTFVNTKICYQALPMREFIALNKRIFPVYFGCQVGLAALTAATRPPFSIVSLAKDLWSAVPLGVVLAMGSLNWFVYGPRTTTASLVRRALHGNTSPLGCKYRD